MPIFEIFIAATAAEGASLLAAPELMAAATAAETAAIAPEAIAATEAAAQGTPAALEATQATAELAPEVGQAAQGITQAGISPGMEAAQLNTLTTPQGITQALSSPEAMSIPGASGSAGGAGINSLQTSALNELAMGPGQTVAGSTADTIAGAKPLDVAGLDQIATPVGAQPSSLQMANIPSATSDVAQFSQDKMLSNLISGNAAPTPTPSGAPDFSNFFESPEQVTDYLRNVPSRYDELNQSKSALEKGFDKAINWAQNNPLAVAGGLYSYMNAQGQRQGMPKRRTPSSLASYHISPNFQAMTPTPNVYTPRYAGGGIMMAAGGSYDDEAHGDDQGYGFASGGIAHFAAGKEVGLDYWTDMMQGQKYPDHLPESVSIPRTGIMYDTDPDTRYKDALTASLIRMGKINKKAGVSPEANIQRPRFSLGQVETGPAILKKKKQAEADDRDDYAAGGITQADRFNMGGYASGSVPRLLKGPGDGMSDDIPASIDGRQPARLADGEFVVPADVVSGLGNGSTDAGAKHLHKMMTDVRRARTGNPKQGKQIVAEKYMPKKRRA